MTYEARWYQKEATEKTIEDLKTKPGNPLIALPTGTGKSIVIGDIVKSLHTDFPAMRIAMLTHSKELVKQNAEKLASIYPSAPIGIYSAGLNKKEADADILFGSIQSVASAMKSGANPFGKRHLVVVDEAHMIAPGDSTQYQQVFGGWRDEFERMKIVGLTATPYRMKGGLLYQGDDRMFDYLSYDLCGMEAFGRLIDEGFLAPLIAMRPDVEIDMSGVKMTAGDFNQRQAADAVATEGLLENAVAELVRHGVNRRSWLVFTSGVENAERVTELLLHHGIAAACVHSKQSSALNDEIIADYKAGLIRCIVNADMLTTGFDHPPTDMIGMLRPTASCALWIQMLGRGTRPCPETGKENCLVLDFAGNTARLGPINDPRIPGKKKPGAGDPPPARICPVCNAYNHSSARTCCMCGHEFPMAEKLTAEASKLKLIVRAGDEVEEQLETFVPRHILYRAHIKAPGGPACLMVEYMCAGMVIRDFVPWEHGGKAAFIADRWWKARYKTPRPATVKAFIDQIQGDAFSVPAPLGIEVDMSARYKGKVKPKLKREIWT
jgi:DNA repair protein RadD